MLTHDKARLALLPALQQGAGAEVAVGDPHLALLDLLQQGGRAYALALVRVLAGQDVRDQGAVGVVDHQRVARHGRSPVRAQWRQAFVTGWQMVAIENAQLPAL